MNGSKPEVDRPIVVEGKYDKIKLSSIVNADIITTEGFGIFKNSEKTALIRKIADKNGIIVMTDSDGAGLVIRNYFNSILPKDKVTHLYIPQLDGKERRKKTASKEGFLGVEGIEAQTLLKILAPFFAGAERKKHDRAITKADFFADGLTGGENSSEKRDRLALAAGLPRNMSSGALLAAMNLLFTYEEYKDLLENEG